MTEYELNQLWNKSRNQLVFAQLAPTFLLITTAGLVPSIREAGNYTIWATLGILLASGILGALVEFSAAHEAQGIARELAKLPNRTAISDTILKTAPLLHVAKYVTPTIFVGIFVGLVAALLGI
jgi:hypothetical protein